MGAMVTAAVISAGATVYGTQQAKSAANKAKKDAQKPRAQTTVSTPYMNDVMSRMSPYVLQEALSTYNHRTSQSGRPAGDNAMIEELLRGIQNNPNYNPVPLPPGVTAGNQQQQAWDNPNAQQPVLGMQPNSANPVSPEQQRYRNIRAAIANSQASDSNYLRVQGARPGARGFSS